MTQDTMEYEVPDRRDDPEPRERVTRSEFEARVRRAAAHVAKGVVLANRDPDRWESEYAFSLEEHASRRGSLDVATEPMEEFTESGRAEIEEIGARIAESLSMTLARRFDLRPDPRPADGSYDLDGG